MHLLPRVWFLMLMLASCVSHDIQTPVLCKPGAITLTLASTTEASGCDIYDGKISVTATGGETPYTYQLDDGLFQDNNSFTGLASSVYKVTVKDKNGCLTTLPNVVVTAADFKFSAAIEPDTECINHNGSVTITVQEGTPPYLFKWEGGTFTENNVFTDLPAGDYEIEIKDAALCGALLHVTVEQGNTETRWSTDILPIMTTKCAINGCHDGKTRTNYKLYANVKSDAAEVKSKTADGSMPFDGPDLPQDQIDLIACWVNEGAPEN